ncbi:MAG: ribonuclease P protein component [Pseudomonadota bacterium]
MALITLKKRSDFLYVGEGRKWVAPSFVLKARTKYQSEPGPQSQILTSDLPHFGFTASRRIGNAVKRNRARRRLKEALTLLTPHSARQGYDYVLIARQGVLNCDFKDLIRDMQLAFKRVHGHNK